MPIIEFLVAKKKIHVGKYANLRGAALKHGIKVHDGIDRLTNCHGYGLCGSCTMEIVEGAENLTPKTEIEKFKLKGKPDNIRLACQAEVLGEVCVITNFKPKPSHQ